MELQYRGSGKVYFNEKEYKCDLYYNEKLGGIILKINVKNEKMLRFRLKYHIYMGN